MTPDDWIAQLEAENQHLRELDLTLLARVQDLEARLAKDSHIRKAYRAEVRT